MARITFECLKQTARFHNPLKEGRLDAQVIETRLDPLTRRQSIYHPMLEGKASILFPDTDTEYLRERAEATRAQCFLCEERWRRTTPTYSGELLPEGRLIQGEAVLFPNLFPLAAYHAVVMLGREHFRPLDQFPVSLLEEALRVSLAFIRRCHAHDPQALYFTINANYLFPAGASVIHPHFQILGSPFPGSAHGRLLDLSEAYFQRHGTCYWSDLVEGEEELGMRTVGALGASRWFTAFAPVGANEVNAVWPEAGHFLEWDEDDCRAAAEGLAHTLCLYHEMKLSTFNFSCFSGPLGQASPHFRCLLRMVNRQNVTPHHRTDDYYFQKLLGNEIIITRPEQLATRLRSHFQAARP